MDKRLGKTSGTEPFLCAVTHQNVRGRHSSHYHLGNGYYISILEKAAMKMNADDIEGVREECRALIPKTTSKPKKPPATRTPAGTSGLSEE